MDLELLFQVCLPGLHITLGFFLRLFTLLEDECHKLDLELAALKSPLESDWASYTSYTSRVHQERVLLDKTDTLKTELRYLNQTLSYLVLHTTTSTIASPAITAVANLMKGRKAQLADLVSGLDNLPQVVLYYVIIILKEKELATLQKGKKAPRKDGPFVRHLWPLSMCLYRQAYYSGSFVGNHVHTALITP